MEILFNEKMRYGNYSLCTVIRVSEGDRVFGRDTKSLLFEAKEPGVLYLNDMFVDEKSGHICSKGLNTFVPYATDFGSIESTPEMRGLCKCRGAKVVHFYGGVKPVTTDGIVLVNAFGGITGGSYYEVPEHAAKQLGWI